MRHERTRQENRLHPNAPLFPLALLALTPLLDIVRLVTRNSVWSRAAFWSAFLGAVLVFVAVVPELVDWLATDRHTRARRAGAAPLTLHVAAFAPLALGVFERLHLAGLSAPTRLDAWPMALAIAGALAWVIGSWMAEARLVVRVRARYQPTGLPLSS
jgi:uncharacterized membrane protein